MALTRARHPMPADVRRALASRRLTAAYRARPAYQRNDYLGWIGRAKRAQTREKRLAQMLDELAAGDAYMGMAYRAATPGWTCPRCKRTFRAVNARHACVAQAPEALLEGYPKALPIYRALAKLLARIGPVEAEATRTQIAFRADRRFAILWIPQMALRRGPPDVYVAFALARRVRSPRIKESVEAAPGVFMHHMRLGSSRDLDAQARAWLEESYATRGLRRA